MITKIAVLMGCLLATVAFAKTEVKPPLGPFKSQLRVTFNLDEVVTTTLSSHQIDDEKKYNFGVPDLGRYQERSPDDVFIEPAPTPIAIIGRTLGVVPQEFDMGEQNTVMPNAINPFQVIGDELPNERPQLPHKMGFDEMAISAPNDFSNGDTGFYPPEWAQPNPFRLQHNMARNNQKNQQFEQPQFNQNAFNTSNENMMGMPMPNQIMPNQAMPWISNNKNGSLKNDHGYR